MAYIVVEDFRGGLDSRRLPIAGVPGTLQTLNNAHISRSGEIEKRKAFVDTYELPEGTFGLFGGNGYLFTFGSTVPTGIPAGVIFVHMPHPGGVEMTKFLSATMF